MGYRRVSRTYRLLFPEGDDLFGLELDVRAMTLGELRNFQEQAREAFEKNDSGWQDEEVRIFLAYVQSWNMEDDDGNAVELSEKGISTVEPRDVKAMLTAWFQRCLGNSVSPELGKESNTGQSFEEASLPMTVGQ